MVHKQMILSFQDTSKVSLVFKWVIVNKFCIRDGKHVVLINNVEKPKTKTEVNKIQKFGYTKMCDNNILPENTSVAKKLTYIQSSEVDLYGDALGIESLSMHSYDKSRNWYSTVNACVIKWVGL